MKDRTADQLHELVTEGLQRIEPKVRHLGVALGLETTGTDRSFGSLGDIALIAQQFAFVRPVIDWAHVHAKSGGGLTTAAAFVSVITFLREQFPGWAIDPLHTQFTDNAFGPKGEIKHVPLRCRNAAPGPLAEAAVATGLRMIVISEAKEEESHDAILADLSAAAASAQPEPSGEGRRLATAGIDFPDPIGLKPTATVGPPSGSTGGFGSPTPTRTSFPPTATPRLISCSTTHRSPRCCSPPRRASPVAGAVPQRRRG